MDPEPEQFPADECPDVPEDKPVKGKGKGKRKGARHAKGAADSKEKPKAKAKAKRKAASQEVDDESVPSTESSSSDSSESTGKKKKKKKKKTKRQKKKKETEKTPKIWPFQQKPAETVEAQRQRVQKELDSLKKDPFEPREKEARNAAIKAKMAPWSSYSEVLQHDDVTLFANFL